MKHFIVKRQLVVACIALSLFGIGMRGVPLSAQSPTWSLAGSNGYSEHQSGAVALWDAADQKLLLVGPGVARFDPGTKKWETLTKEVPEKNGIHPYYQCAFDAESRSIVCLSGGATVYSFSLAAAKWTVSGPAAELAGLSWQVMAHDPERRLLVVMGSDKQIENLGWTRTVIFDLAAGTWRTLPPPGNEILVTHRRMVAALEATTELVGRIRLAWFRDAEGAGSDKERAELITRSRALKAHPGCTSMSQKLEPVVEHLETKELLKALKAARVFQRQLEDATFAQYPVPRSRRNAPLAFDPQSKVFVLFGGDHEDYLLNDTWILDLDKGWRQIEVDKAPSPRAGHALVSMPQAGGGGVALYEGYVQSSSTDYGSSTWYSIEPKQLWHFDSRAARWTLRGVWEEKKELPANGHFYGYAAEYYSPPALTPAADGRLLLPVPANGNSESSFWSLEFDSARRDDEGREQWGTAPNQRQYRSNSFVASFGEVDEAAPSKLDELPTNRWVELPASPRNPCVGRRQRDWGTSVWDSDREQILLWGGGHCVQCCSPVAHYSPNSGRTVEGYDADEPYGRNGGGGYDSSLLNRPWISTHNYNHYAYDPKCKLLVTARGYLYDPERMDWLREARAPRPFRFAWSKTLVETSPHGAVAWAQRNEGEDFGLWMFDRQQGWQDLNPQGKVPVVYCDSEGAVYDDRRDRLLLGSGGGYNNIGDGTLTTFDFASRKIEKLTPANIELGKVNSTREMVYIPEADVVLFGSTPLVVGDEDDGKRYTRVYHCSENKYYLLDAGEVAYGHSTGWMYDTKKKIAYVFSNRGESWAMKVDAAKLQLLEHPPNP